VQWFWVEQMIERGQLPKGADQFNSLHERLIARWREIGSRRFLHLSCMTQSIEDAGTVSYLDDCARQAGLETLASTWATSGSTAPVSLTGRAATSTTCSSFTRGNGYSPIPSGDLRPCLKPALSNRLEDDPVQQGCVGSAVGDGAGTSNLLPCYFEDDPQASTLGERYARKPLFSREGADVELHDAGAVVRGLSGGYGAEGHVRQALCRSGF